MSISYSQESKTPYFSRFFFITYFYNWKLLISLVITVKSSHKSRPIYTFKKLFIHNINLTTPSTPIRFEIFIPGILRTPLGVRYTTRSSRPVFANLFLVFASGRRWWVACTHDTTQNQFCFERRVVVGSFCLRNWRIFSVGENVMTKNTLDVKLKTLLLI